MMKRGAWCINLTRVRMSRSKVKVTRAKKPEKLLSHPHWQCKVRPTP